MSDERDREIAVTVTPDTATTPDDGVVVEFGHRWPSWSGHRGLVATIGAGVLVIVAAVMVVHFGPASPPTADPSATPSPPDGADLVLKSVPTDVMVYPNGNATWLPDNPVARPTALLHESGADAPPLSTRPVRRANALIQGLSGDPVRAPVFVWGDDGRLRRLDVDLVSPMDEHGRAQPVLDPTSLSPEGTRAAFAQPDAVVVVDLTTGTSQRYQMSDRQRKVFGEDVAWQDVIWHADGVRLFVVAEKITMLLDTRTGRVTRTRVLGRHLVAPQYGGGNFVHALVPSEDPPGPDYTYARLVRSTPSGNTAHYDLVAGPHMPAGAWFGSGWRVEGRIARASVVSHGEGRSPGGHLAQTVAVVDADKGTITRLLAIATRPHRPPEVTSAAARCCEVVGWLDARTVLVSQKVATGDLHRHQVLAWNIRTGEVHRFLELPPRTRVALRYFSPD